MPDPAHTNRLAAETSPYLLQHAHNPVDWHAWGPEAFDVARRENKPIFLSVGYSTCYWCHVMERQCFEDESIAAEMNRRFVNIKLDREERPDVDQLYMTAVQVMTRQGGWPMSVFLTPDLRPFYGGTYFPPRDSYGRPGFPRLLTMLDDAWHNRRDEVNRSADQFVGIIRQLARPPRASSAMTVDAAWIEEIIHRSTADFDSVHGGFGPAPKFPRQTLLELLLVHLREADDPRLLGQVRFSLDAMARGGIRDHLGGAFHRYSTDEFWLVPHFEIMLYDNAMLLWIYVEAYRQTEDRRYAAIARGIADFILREMTSPQGVFYTALDAEVDASEGGSYLWTRDEVIEALKPHATDQEIARFCRVYGLDGGPNFADPHQGQAAPDKNVLHLPDDPPDGDSALLDEKLHRLREALYAARRLRKQPMLDTKILTSWNALMIRGLAYAAQILKESRYLTAASKAADHLLRHHRGPDGSLLRVGSANTSGSSAKSSAFVDDYAFLIQALLALEEAGDDEIRREQAGELMLIMQSRFSDPATGGLFYSVENADDLIVRQMIGSDNPLPSGNGIAAQVLLALGRLQDAARIISEFAGQLQSVGEGMSALIQGALRYVRQHGTIKISAGSIEAADRPLSPQQLSARIVSIKPHWSGPQYLLIQCTVLQGFHLNAGAAGPNLIATQLTVLGAASEEVAGIDYPPGESRQFEFDDQELSIYEGKFDISVRFKTPPASHCTLELALTYQPCDQSSCLPPTTKPFSIIVP